jgi:hypothetical protein
MNNMNKYKEVLTQEDVEEMLKSISYFHDSLAKEFHIINRGYVDIDHKMIMSHQFDMQLLIQSQFEPNAIELILINLDKLQLKGSSEYFDAKGTIKVIRNKAGEIEDRRITLILDSGLEIVAEKMFYRTRNNWLGKKVLLKSEIPSIEAIPAKPIEGKWRQCSNCSDAWEENIDEIFIYCPSCGKLTEYEE